MKDGVCWIILSVTVYYCMKKFPSIKKNSEYRVVYNSGRSYAYGVLVMYCADNGLDHNRLGISVSKRVGNSVIRHTFCRKFREIFRLNNKYTVPGKDLIVVARSRAGEVPYEKLNRYYIKLLGEHGLISGPPDRDSGIYK